MKRMGPFLEPTDLPSLKNKVAKLEKQVINLTKKHVEGSKKPDHVVYGQKSLHRIPKATSSAIFGKSGCSCKSVWSCSSQICGCVKNSNKCGLSCKCDNEMCKNQKPEYDQEKNKIVLQLGWVRLDAFSAARPVQTWKATGCSCKGNCSSRMCGCVKNSNSCDPSCKCDEEICKNNRLCYRDRDMYLHINIC
ncbi:hypothetical protein DBV15_05917 [Temnothorax longispinosus]|uniref:CRC domain-containing protein n=1 Tax=Temnothorax longispinosus TaxID=300112 RepID=A0A4S2KI61_9HYME|nr:hypothetical protein DBV15_05917 [Temnothorax longispinosus]